MKYIPCSVISADNRLASLSGTGFIPQRYVPRCVRATSTKRLLKQASKATSAATNFNMKLPAPSSVEENWIYCFLFAGGQFMAHSVRGLLRCLIKNNTRGHFPKCPLVCVRFISGKTKRAFDGSAIPVNATKFVTKGIVWMRVLRVTRRIFRPGTISGTILGNAHGGWVFFNYGNIPPTISPSKFTWNK